MIYKCETGKIYPSKGFYTNILKVLTVKKKPSKIQENLIEFDMKI